MLVLAMVACFQISDDADRKSFIEAFPLKLKK
jgi:hypothetical protein